MYSMNDRVTVTVNYTSHTHARLQLTCDAKKPHHFIFAIALSKLSIITIFGKRIFQ